MQDLSTHTKQKRKSWVCHCGLLGMQDVQEGDAVTKRFHSIMQGLVDGMRKEQPAESSIAAHLLSIKDPETGEDMLCLNP